MNSAIRSAAPNELLLGIMACGGVKEYYNYCINEEKNKYNEIARNSGNMRVASPYPDNAHEVIERAVTKVQKKRLNIVADLIAAGLTTSLPDWWGIPSLRRGRIGNAGRAHRTMVPDSTGERFVLQRDGVSWPIFCTWANFSFNAREIAVGERMGTPLDVSHVEEATYLVNEANEDQAINGLTDEQGQTMTIDGLSAPGILSSTNTFSYPTWTGLTGAQIEAEVMGAIQSLRTTHPGPFTVYYPGNYDSKMNSKYTTTYQSGTIRQELTNLGPYGGRNIEVKLSDTLPDDRVVVMQMDSEAVDVVIGQQPLPISWQDGPKWNTFWVVLDCVIFRMFANKNGDYGVAVGNLE